MYKIHKINENIIFFNKKNKIINITITMKVVFFSIKLSKLILFLRFTFCLNIITKTEYIKQNEKVVNENKSKNSFT